MIIELGHFALVLALVVALVQSIVPMVGAARGSAALMGVAKPAALLQLVLVLTAFFTLMYAFVTSDFSVVAVYQNSHTTKPLIYKSAAFGAITKARW